MLFCPLSTLYLSHSSFHLRFGSPLLLFHDISTSNILLTMCSSFILLTWPYHFSRFSVALLTYFLTTVANELQLFSNRFNSNETASCVSDVLLGSIQQPCLLSRVRCISPLRGARQGRRTTRLWGTTLV